MSYDVKCFTLAKLFLEDTPKFREMAMDKQAAHADALAKDIQSVIEDYLRFEVEA